MKSKERPYLITDTSNIPGHYKNRHPLPVGMRGKSDPMFYEFRPEHRTIVEVGSQWGWWPLRAARSSRFPKEASIYCIDPWATDAESVRHYHGGEDNLWDWQINVREFLGSRVFGVRGTSEEAAKSGLVPGLVDYLFIDGDHTEDAVFRDLELWIPRMSPGGIVFGHDWRGLWGRGVRAAVSRYFGSEGAVSVKDCYWSLRGRELSACWVWRKPESLKG